MDLDFTTEQDELRQSVRSVLDRECPPSVPRAVVEGRESPAALWQRMVDLDWTALAVPEDHGGLGLGFVELAIVVEELGHALAPGAFVPTVAHFAPAVREAGAGATGRHLLGAVARGELTGALAVAEATGGWEPSRVSTIAWPEGESWRLEGTKRYVLGAPEAVELVVVARLPGTAGDDGLALFAVPRDAVVVEPVVALDATRSLGTVVLDGTRVGPDRVLGEPGDAAGAIRRAVEEATVATALEAVGTCERILEVALDHAKVREQFGRPIGSFQAVQHALADMLVALEAARALAYFAAATIAEDDPRRSLATSMSKAAAGDAARRIAHDGIQLLGGIGYTWEHDVHLCVKRAMTGAALFGTAAWHRRRVAALIGL